MNILTDAITQFFINLINGFLQGISGPFNSLVPLLGNTPLPLTTTNAVVSGTWMVITGVANAFLGLIVVIAAIQMLYGQTTGTLYISPGLFVPKLVLTIVLVNLSQLIGQDLILLNNALCGLVRVDVANFIQQTGPVAGSDLTQQELYSPLIYAPVAPTSASIAIQLADGFEYRNATASYATGVP
jgi:hypothetical protein